MKRETIAILSIIGLCGIVLIGVSMTKETNALCKTPCHTSLTLTISPIPPAKTVEAGSKFMISGRLLDASYPLAHKTITITSNSPTITGSTTTDERGYYIFTSTAPNTPGQYKVIIQYAEVPPYVNAKANTILTVNPSQRE